MHFQHLQSIATHELFLDLINITDYQGRLSEYYDERVSDSIGYITQPFFS